MKNSIYITISLLCIPLVSLSMSVLKNVFCYKNINKCMPIAPTRKHYSKSIHYLEEKLKFIETEEMTLTNQCSKILQSGFTIHEKMNLIEKKIDLLKTMDNLKHSLTIDLGKLRCKNSFYNTINKILQTAPTNACKADDIKETVKLFQKVIAQEKSINTFKQELDEKYTPIFQNTGFKLPPE